MRRGWLSRFECVPWEELRTRGQIDCIYALRIVSTSHRSFVLSTPTTAGIKISSSLSPPSADRVSLSNVAVSFLVISGAWREVAWTPATARSELSFPVPDEPGSTDSNLPATTSFFARNSSRSELKSPLRSGTSLSLSEMVFSLSSSWLSWLFSSSLSDDSYSASIYKGQ